MINVQVCSCPPGYEGDPYTGCTQDPCNPSPCGENGICERNGKIWFHFNDFDKYVFLRQHETKFDNYINDTFSFFLPFYSFLFVLSPTHDCDWISSWCMTGAWLCAGGSQVSLNAVIIDARISRGGKSLRKFEKEYKTEKEIAVFFANFSNV